MANAGRQSINYTPRMTDDEALEALPKGIRDVLRYAVTDWDAYQALRNYKALKIRPGMTARRAQRAIIKIYRAADLHFIGKGFIRARGRRPKLVSPCIECGVKPLYQRADGTVTP